MAINIKEILHPSDSDIIKFDKINYNFDQILINGGGPTGPTGQKGVQGADGATGLKGEKGDIGVTGPIGPAGTTDTPWAKVAHATLAGHILKPKIDTDTVPATIWLGDSTFDETSNDGYTDSISRIVLARTTGIDHYTSYFTSSNNILNFTGRAFDTSEFYGFKKDLASSTSSIGFEVEVDKIILNAADGYNKISAKGNIELTSTTANVEVNAIAGIFEVNPPAIVNNYLNVNTTSHVKIAAGNTAQRPTGAAGMIRYNNELNRYEGHDGIAWRGLGGLIDIDGDTYITAEKNSDEDILRFNVGSTSELVPGEGVEPLTIGENISDGFESSLDVVLVKRVQSNLDDTIIQTGKGIVTKAVTATLGTNEAQPANQGTTKEFRRLHDYYYQPSVVLDSSPGSLSSSPFTDGSGVINTTNVKQTSKLIRTHKRTNNFGNQIVDEWPVSIAYDNSTSRISYVKTGHMVQCWGQLDFYQASIDYTELEGAGTVALDGKSSTGAIPTNVSASRLAFYFAEPETFPYTNASDNWIFFPISMNMNAGYNLESEPPVTSTYWGAIKPGAKYFNILSVNGKGRSRFPADVRVESTSGDLAALEADFVNLQSINDGQAVVDGIPTVPTTLSWSFSMPTLVNSYDVINTVQSQYTEDGALVFSEVGDPDGGSGGPVLGGSLPNLDSITLSSVTKPSTGTTAFSFSKTDNNCTGITVQYAISATGPWVNFVGSGPACTSPFTITYSSAGTTKYFRLVQARSGDTDLTSNVLSTTYPGTGIIGGPQGGPFGPIDETIGQIGG